MLLDKNILVKYDGERFSGGKSPIAVLAGAAHLQDVIFEICTQIIKSKAPGLKIGKKFRSDLEMSVTELKDGCCELAVVFDHPEKGLPLLPSDTGSSREAIVSEAFKKIQEMLDFRGEVPEGHYIPLSIARKLSKFTSNMREGEDFIIAPRSPYSSSIDFSKKSAISRYAGSTKERNIISDVKITGLDLPDVGRKMLKLTHEAERITYMDVEVPSAISSVNNEIIAELIGLPIKVSVRKISRIGRDTIYKFERFLDGSIENMKKYVSLFERLSRLSETKAGWLTFPDDSDPHGAELTAAAKDKATYIIKNAPSIVPYAGVFLTEMGGISLEIRSQNVKVSAKIQSDGEVRIVPSEMRRKSEGVEVAEFFKRLVNDQD